jgi:hypothetical protein
VAAVGLALRVGGCACGVVAWVGNNEKIGEGETSLEGEFVAAFDLWV